jgi:Sulfotransferase family/Glycosyl transferase family 2
LSGPQSLPPIFIVGMPRSGTTLLAAMMGAHPRLMCGPETHFFDYLPADSNSLCRRDDWPERAVDYLCSITHAGGSMPANYGLTRPELAAALFQREPSIASILDGLLELPLRRAGKPRWVEKTPDHLPYVAQIRRYFPDSPIVRIIRDPRDVLASLVSMPWGPASYFEGIRFWTDFDDRSAQFFAVDPNTHTLHYEDLVHSPETTLKELCRFLREPFDAAMLDTSESARFVNATNEAWKGKVGEKIDASRVQAWRQKLTDDERRLVEALLGDRIRAYGYESAASELPRYVEVYPRGILKEYPKAAEKLVAEGCRFWRARGEKPGQAIFVGNPYHDEWLGPGRWGRLVKTAAIIRAAARYRVGGVPVAWLQDPDAPDHRGVCYGMIACVLPAPVPIGCINEVNLAPTSDNPSGTPPVSDGTPGEDEKPNDNDQARTSSAPLISVCMPVYNAKRYLAEAVESILGQTFRDFEFLIIDDGSTDRSLAILKRYAARDARIRLSSGPNAGLVARLNEMLHQARGDLIARMDADDVALPERFARQVEFLRSHPEVDVVGGAQEHVGAKGHLLSVHYDPQGHEEIDERALAGACPINHPSVMMRRKAVLAVGGYRAEMLPAEDLDLWLRMGERGRLANLPEVITRYRLHESSVSASLQLRQLSQWQVAVDGACDRRGIPRRGLNLQPWRPVDRRSKHEFAMRHGWEGFLRGDRPAAMHFGLRAVSLMPWRSVSWRLLACAILKMKSANDEACRTSPP